jgi:hypothetical protein
MRIDPEDLRRHYASLSDEALRSLHRGDLTEIARPIYDQELARRRESPPPPEIVADDDDAGFAASDEMEEDLEIDDGPTPDWLDDAACACSILMPAQARLTEVPTAVRARAVLRANRIPCHIAMMHEEPARVETSAQRYLRLRVPGALAIHATSVLDRDLFNEDQEAEWRTTLETLTGEELLELDPDIFCAGLLDRVARLKKAYQDEMSRRGLTRRFPQGV